MGNFKGYGKGFKAGNNEIQRLPRHRYVLSITIKDIANAKCVHPDTVRRAIKSGSLDVGDLRDIAEYILKGKHGINN